MPYHLSRSGRSMPDKTTMRSPGLQINGQAVPDRSLDEGELRQTDNLPTLIRADHRTSSECGLGCVSYALLHILRTLIWHRRAAHWQSRFRPLWWCESTSDGRERSMMRRRAQFSGSLPWHAYLTAVPRAGVRAPSGFGPISTFFAAREQRDRILWLFKRSAGTFRAI